MSKIRNLCIFVLDVQYKIKVPTHIYSKATNTGPKFYMGEEDDLLSNKSQGQDSRNEIKSHTQYLSKYVSFSS